MPGYVVRTVHFTFTGHLGVGEVEFLQCSVGKETEFQHEQPVVSTLIV